MAKLALTVVSQEQEILRTDADSITTMTETGEVTLLPFHIPLFTQLQTGVLRYTNNDTEDQVIVSDGFLTLSPNNEVTVMVDSATHAREISVQKAEAAIAAAKKTMEQSTDRRELILAEASLKKALLEIRVAQKTKRASI